MYGVSKYEELMATMLVRQIQDHLKVIGNNFVFTNIEREILVNLVNELYRVLNEEDQHENR